MYMYMCICICIYIYIYTYIHTYIYCYWIKLTKFLPVDLDVSTNVPGVTFIPDITTRFLSVYKYTELSLEC